MAIDTGKIRPCLWFDSEAEDAATARSHLTGWIEVAMASALKHFRSLSKTIAKHVEGIVRVFELGVTNAAAESLNARIQAVRVKCRGHRNFQMPQSAAPTTCVRRPHHTNPPSPG